MTCRKYLLCVRILKFCSPLTLSGRNGEDAAKAIEKALVLKAEIDIKAIEIQAKAEVTILRDDLVGKISKL
jgi:hypothetical protein